MNRVFVISLCLLVGLANAEATETLVTFDTIQHDETLTDDLLSLGLVFEPISWFGTASNPQSPLAIPTVKHADHADVNLPASFGNILSPTPPSTQFQSQGEFRLRFVQPGDSAVARTVISVAADFIDVEWYDTRMEAYDINGTLIDAVDIPIGADLGVYRGEIIGTAIASVIFRLGSLDQTPGATDGVVLDNLSFVVPEPTSLSLLVIGGLALIKRKKKFSAKTRET